MLLQQQSNVDLSKHLAEMSQVDLRLTASIFTDVFSSIWNQLPSRGSSKRKQLMEYFLQSGQLASSNLPMTPLLCFFKAIQKCSTPDIRVDSALLENIAVTHGGWFDALDEMEKRCREVKDVKHNNYTEQMKQFDNLMSVYKNLGEEDLRVALWKRRACMPATYRALQFYNQVSFHVTQKISIYRACSKKPDCKLKWQ